MGDPGPADGSSPGLQAFPSGTDWQDERQKMKNICSSCHGDSWINDFYNGFDKAVEEYNEVYFKPAKAKLDELYDKGLLDKTKFFDERLEVEYYELWHHEGRRARMGAMMMAPDYAWWHGFYECKLRFANFMEEANHLIETGQKKPTCGQRFPQCNGGHHKTGIHIRRPISRP
jgi:hydroxylamine dehydrogenase